MASRLHTDLSLPVASGGFGWPLRIVATLVDWRRRVQFRRHLAHLDDHLLDDIGIDRQTANAEIRKPFWRL